MSPHVQRLKHPQAILLQAATRAFQTPTTSACTILKVFTDSLTNLYHARLSRRWHEDLMLGIFQSALDRCLGDPYQAARQVIEDLRRIQAFHDLRVAIDWSQAA